MNHRDDLDQIIEPISFDFGLTRRTFVQALGAGLLILTAAPASAQEHRGGSSGRRPSRPVNLDARLHLGKDGSITVLCGKVEAGQGARAEVLQAAAEELAVPVDALTILLADTSIVPDDGITAGSGTTPRTIPSVRQACAAARKLLQSSGAQSYADLANSDSFKGETPRDVSLKPVTEWKILGQTRHRPNARDIVSGAHRYPSDITPESLMYGKVLRPPSYGATVKDLDSSKAHGANVVHDGNFVGVVASTTHLARSAIQSLADSATWDQRPEVSSVELYQYLRDHARGGLPDNPFKDQLSSAAKSLKATYLVPYAQHAPMEPRAAVAQWQADHLTVWTATQNPFGVRRELATAFHLDERNVRVIVPDFGGGFGGKHTGECAVEAARLAKSAGHPVRLQWTRQEEFTFAYFRPAAVIDAEASLDDKGFLTSWHFTNINSGPSAVESPYRCASAKSQFVQSEPPLRHGSYRGLAATANNFARECFVDELACAADKDPLAFRLAHLENPRLRAVLEKAAREFGWAPNMPNVGLACGTEKGSYVAACVELEPAQSQGAFRIKRIVQVFECGAILNPDNLRNQVVGAIIMGLGPATREAIEFENGVIKNSSFWKYAVPRFADVPQIDVHLLDRRDLPSAGAGETPLICIAPALGNALFRTTRQRYRQMPLRPLSTPV